jgi:hypothetical protein
MKICPKCNSEVDDNFDMCWNCQYSFTEGKVIENDDFGSVCPKCNIIVDPSMDHCPNCRYSFGKKRNQTGTELQGVKKVACHRCNVPLLYQGNYKFHEGAQLGVIGNLFELFENRESFELYCCPQCGKVEFFYPGFD